MSIIVFLVVLAVLIFAHELGHFLAAKSVGVRVDEFAIGFPPRVASWGKGETKYSLGLVPFGGFVKIFGEDEKFRLKDEMEKLAGAAKEKLDQVAERKEREIRG